MIYVSYLIAGGALAGILLFVLDECAKTNTWVNFASAIQLFVSGGKSLRRPSVDNARAKPLERVSAKDPGRSKEVPHRSPAFSRIVARTSEGHKPTAFAFSNSAALASALDVFPEPQLSMARAQPRAAPVTELAIRISDIIVSIAALFFMIPALAVIATAIKVSDGGPIFYARSQIGRNGQEFTAYKFRSMYVGSDALLNRLLMMDAAAQAELRADYKLRADPRVTTIGYFLRKTSLDEVPLLINVIQGKMSLVGPRPIVRAEISKYGRSFRQYASVPPGITGLWQVMARNDMTYRRRVAMDRLFARRKSIGLYFYILSATIPALLTRRRSY